MQATEFWGSLPETPWCAPDQRGYYHHVVLVGEREWMDVWGWMHPTFRFNDYVFELGKLGYEYVVPDGKTAVYFRVPEGRLVEVTAWCEKNLKKAVDVYRDIAGERWRTWNGLGLTVAGLTHELNKCDPKAPVRIGAPQTFIDIVMVDEWPVGSPEGHFVELKREGFDEE